MHCLILVLYHNVGLSVKMKFAMQKTIITLIAFGSIAICSYSQTTLPDKEQTTPLPQPSFSFGNNLSLKDSAISQETHNLITELVKQDKFSGVVVILKNDSTIYRGAFGNASKEFNSPNTFSTAFNLASMTKMFTGIAIAQLVEQKKLSFNDLITKYLSDLPDSVVKDVTVYNLLTHTSGLSSYWTEEFHQSNHAKYRMLDDYLPFIKKDKQQFKPGTQWAYSNTGYMLLGLIIEEVSGMNYFDYIKKNIFERAGMLNADFYESDIPNKNVAFAYTRYNRYKNDTTNYYNTFFIAPVKGSPAGGAYASGEDLAHFVHSLMSNKLVSKKFTDTVTLGKVAYGKPEQQKKYAFGFANQIVNDKLIIFHDGGANGISTDIDIYPELGYTVIVLCNYDDPLGWEVVRKTRTLITK